MEHACAHAHTAPGGPRDTSSHWVNSGLRPVSLGEFRQPRPAIVWSGAELRSATVAFRLLGESVKKLTQSECEIGGTGNILDQAACFATMVLATNSKYRDTLFHVLCDACLECFRNTSSVTFPREWNKMAVSYFKNMHVRLA